MQTTSVFRNLAACLILLLPDGPLFRVQSSGIPPSVEQHQIVTCSYPAQPVPLFFKSLINNHLEDFSRLEQSVYDSICRQYSLEQQGTGNRSVFFTIDILHKLFTSKTCADGSTGDILNIPYYWHWVSPNPRHDIMFTLNGKPLTSVRHPKGYEKYATFADIDRTPFLFLTDMLAPLPRYCSARGDTFSTFGWCSEREMAFACLCRLLGLKADVIAPGNHSWTEIKVSMISVSGERRDMLVVVDNTFDLVAWSGDEPNEPSLYYNQKVISPTTLGRLRLFSVSAEASSRIEHAVVNYLRKKTNDMVH